MPRLRFAKASPDCGFCCPPQQISRGFKGGKKTTLEDALESPDDAKVVEADIEKDIFIAVSGGRAEKKRPPARFLFLPICLPRHPCCAGPFAPEQQTDQFPASFSTPCLHQDLKSLLSTLLPKERYVLTQYFGVVRPRAAAAAAAIARARLLVPVPGARQALQRRPRRRGGAQERLHPFAGTQRRVHPPAFRLRALRVRLRLARTPLILLPLNGLLLLLRLLRLLPRLLLLRLLLLLRRRSLRLGALRDAPRQVQLVQTPPLRRGRAVLQARALREEAAGVAGGGGGGVVGSGGCEGGERALVLPEGVDLGPEARGGGGGLLAAGGGAGAGPRGRGGR